MKHTPLFSVLIAQYNNGKYLQEAIDSVKAQTYTNWEIIIVDDNSTDNSKELYKLYENDERIKIFYNEKNQGCGYTKRRCAELADGEICGFLDPDDALLPNALNLMVSTHLSDDKISVVHSRCYLCDKNMKILYEYKLLILKENEDYFSHRNHGACNFSSYKNAYYKKTEGISPFYCAGVDQDLYFKLEEVGKVYVLNEFTYKWRTGTKTSITSDRDKTDLWNIIVMYEVCLRRGLDVNQYLLPHYKKYVNKSMYLGAQLEKKSKTYLIGKTIIYPFLLFRQLFNRIKKRA